MTNNNQNEIVSTDKNTSTQKITKATTAQPTKNKGQKTSNRSHYYRDIISGFSGNF